MQQRDAAVEPRPRRRVAGSRERDGSQLLGRRGAVVVVLRGDRGGEAERERASHGLDDAHGRSYTV